MKIDTPDDFYKNLKLQSLEPSASASVFGRRPNVFRPSAMAEGQNDLLSHLWEIQLVKVTTLKFTIRKQSFQI